MSLDISYKNTDEEWVVSLSGEIDIYTANKFKETLHELSNQRIKDIKLECTNLTYMDSTGFGVLIGALKKLKAQKKSIIIENACNNILKLLKITGLDKVFVIK